MNSRPYAYWPHQQQSTALPEVTGRKPPKATRRGAESAGPTALDHSHTTASTPRQTEPATRLMTLEEAADFLAVTPRWVYDNHEQLAMPALRLGRALRFRRNDLDAWLNTRTAS